MVDLMDLLRDVLVCSLQVWMLNDFGKNMFPYRVGSLWKRIGVYFAAALCIFIANHMGTTLFNITIIPVSYTIAAIIIFQGSKWKKVIMACCYYMLAIIPEFLFAAITEAYGVTGTANEFQSELEKTLAILLMKTMTFLLVKCINQITRKKNYLTIENKLFTVLLTLPIATIIIFMCIYYSHISFTGVNRIMIPIGAALLLMTNICIFAVFDKLIERSEEVKKMELLYQKSKAENINQKYINKVNEDKRAFLHDVNKFLCITANLIETTKMKAKDFITLGIFTVLFFAVVMVCIFASAATVVTFAFGCAIAALPGGIIYMLMRAKVPKAWSVLLSGVVIGLIEFLIGAGWAVAVGFIAGAIIAEILSRIGQYKNFWLNTIGYSIYMTFFALGTYLPMVIMSGYVDDMSTSNGVSAEYLTELHSFMNSTMIVIIAVVTFVAGIIGALIAKGLFKKHFQKAGII